MFDGIGIEIELLDFKKWRSQMPFEIHTPLNTDTGELKSKGNKDNSINGKKGQFAIETITHTAKFETYDIVVREVIRTNKTPKYYLKVKGSLHKNWFNGSNYKRFYYYNVCSEIDKICTTLQINRLVAKVVNLEFGVNIEVDFTPHMFLEDNLINYKNNQFNQYAPDKRNKRLGFECVLSQYVVKCYDKSLQFDLDYKLMRFELKFKKMQKLKRIGIINLHDLTKIEIINKLGQLLINAWNDILLNEPLETGATNLTQLQKDLIRDANNPKYWLQLNNLSPRKLKHHRAVFKGLIVNFGKGYHADILEKIENEWKYLLIAKLPDFTIKIIGKKGQSCIEQKKVCLSCKKDISQQQGNSKFCSPKYVGTVQAHKCRNENSNKRNNFKNKVSKIISKGVLFVIEPFFVRT